LIYLMDYCNWHPDLISYCQAISQESAPSPIIMKTFVFTFGILALVCQMAASFKIEIEMIIKPQLELSGEESGVDDVESMQGNEMPGETPLTGGDTAVDATQGTSKQIPRPQMKARGGFQDKFRMTNLEFGLNDADTELIHDTMHRVAALENRVAQIEKTLGTSKPQIKARDLLHNTMMQVAALEYRVALIENKLELPFPVISGEGGPLSDTMNRVTMLEKRVAQIEKTLANRRY